MITPQILAMYLGCQIEIVTPSKWKNVTKLNSIDLRDNTIVCGDELIILSDPYATYKPILRPLSSMSEEEKKEYRKFNRDWKTDNIMPTIKISHILQAHHSERGVKTTIWLLSKGFDLFNLIEQDLALDSSKLLTTMKTLSPSEDKTAEPTAIQILNNQSHGFNKGQTESALKAMTEYATLCRNKAIEEAVDLVDEYWHDDNFHEKPDLISQLNKRKNQTKQ